MWNACDRSSLIEFNSIFILINFFDNDHQRAIVCACRDNRHSITSKLDDIHHHRINNWKFQEMISHFWLCVVLYHTENKSISNRSNASAATFVLLMLLLLLFWIHFNTKEIDVRNIQQTYPKIILESPHLIDNGRHLIICSIFMKIVFHQNRTFMAWNYEYK